MSKTHFQKAFLRNILCATKLTSSGSLMQATRLIQRALLGDKVRRAPEPARTKAPQGRAAQATTPVKATSTAASELARQTDFERPDHPVPQHTAPTAAAVVLPSFTRHTFNFDGERYPYRLYVPASPPGGAQAAAAIPLIVLLHGCTQNAQDFARGTAMNALADAHQCMVLYPEQIAKSNSQRCWNWFEAGHQQRDHGEPGMIAALTQKVLAAEHHGRRCDTQRVYIAGLSAGGAMAAVVASIYPDLFAALGVHSGLAAGAAQDLMSAFGAMRVGAKGRGGPALPTIVFHGTADRTVHPDNGDHVTEAALAALNASGLALEKSGQTVYETGERAARRTTYRAANGKPYAEHWRVEAAPHAWSGGDTSGSYTDPDGPSASEAMLRFFLQHSKS